MVDTFETVTKDQAGKEQAVANKLKRTKFLKRLSLAITILGLIATILSFSFDVGNQKKVEEVLKYVDSKNTQAKIDISDINEVKNKLQVLENTQILTYIDIASKVMGTLLSVILSWNLYYRLNTVAVDG